MGKTISTEKDLENEYATYLDKHKELIFKLREERRKVMRIEAAKRSHSH